MNITLRIFRYLSIVLLLVSGVMAELKIGFINSEKILLEYQGAKEASDKLNKEMAKYEQEATERQKRIQEMKDQLEKQSLLLSAERKKELEAKMQQEYIEYQKFLQEKFGQQGDVAKKNMELLNPIIKKVNKILDKIAEKENYDFIFDTKGGVVYAKPAYDLTDKVLQALNSEK